MPTWQEVVKIALVGTERVALSAEPAGDVADALLGRLDPKDRESALLFAASALALCRRAGYVPAQDSEPLPEAAEEQEPPRCSDGAARDLSLMLAGEFRDALPMWLTAVAAAGQRVPEEHLPGLLNLGRQQTELRLAIIAAIGPRGRWLAAWNPEWKYALGLSQTEREALADPAREQETWETGSREARAVVLESVRQADPARARQMVEATWMQDTHEDRAAFLRTFAAGLSMEDEPFLESALDDRRKEVRRAAQDLLLRLPESRLCARMTGRAAPLLAVKKKLVGPESIEVTLPQACDKAMVRDGIEAKPPYGTGEKAWWLEQLIAAVPPRFWNGHFDRSAAAILERNRSAEWGLVLLNSWSQAALRHRDREWAEAALDVWINKRGGEIDADLHGWAEVLSKEALADRVLRLVKAASKAITPYHSAHDLLLQCGPVWSAALARAVLENLNAHSARGNLWAVAEAMQTYAPCIPPEVMSEFIASWEKLAEQETYVRNQMEQHRAETRFRREMLDKITGSDAR